MNTSYFLAKIAEIKITIAHLIMAISLLHPFVPTPYLGAITKYNASNCITAQRIDNTGWYVRFCSGDELTFDNTIIKLQKTGKTEEEANIALRNLVKITFPNVFWDKVDFEFKEDNSIKNVTWENGF